MYKPHSYLHFSLAHSMEIPNFRPKITLIWNGKPSTSSALTSLIANPIAPPINRDIVELQREKDDDCSDGNAGGEGG